MHLLWKDNMLFGLNSYSISNTKLKFFDAFLQLAREKKFDSISAKDIYTSAGLAKSTFYQHFNSKEDILRWYWGLISEAGIVQIGRTLTWEEGHYITTSGVALANDLLRASAQSRDTMSGFIPFEKRERKRQIRTTLTDYKKINITEKLEFQISSLAAAEQAAIDDYFIEGNITDIDKFVDYLISIVPRDLYEAMQLAIPEKRESQSNPWAFLLS